MTIDFTVFKGSEDGTIKQAKTSKPDLKNNEVLVQVTASGLCGTDEHYRTTDMALGHEGVGRVKAVGPAVSELKVGDRVGWGYEHDSCGHCKSFSFLPPPPPSPSLYRPSSHHVTDQGGAYGQAHNASAASRLTAPNVPCTAWQT